MGSAATADCWVCSVRLKVGTTFDSRLTHGIDSLENFGIRADLACTTGAVARSCA